VSWAHLTDNSRVLTAQGWLSPGAAGTEAVLMGIDRAGRPSLGKVLVEHSPQEFPVFLGTRSSFAWLHAQCRIVASGEAIVASNVLDHDVRDYHFETFVDLESTELCGELLWNDLMTRACFVGDDVIVLRQRSPLSAPAEPWMHTFERCSRFYLMLRKSELLAAVLARGANAVWLICSTISYVSSDGSWRLSIEDGCLGTWMVSALQSMRTRYALSFDTLQFSSFIDLSLQPVELLPLERGACSFRAAQPTSSYRMLWEDNSWGPIVSGFIVAPAGI
jgi:hypothetical protein